MFTLRRRDDDINWSPPILSQREIREAIRIFEAIRIECEDKIKSLESCLLIEVNARGSSFYATNLSWSIKTERDCLCGINEQIERYKNKIQ